MTDIKTMQLYPAPERIEHELAARGYDTDIPIAVLAELDQLHYHGADAVDVAIQTLGITGNDRLLEVGSGWGGPSRWIAHKTGARIEALELQEDYHVVGQRLTQRTGLSDHVSHIRGDFLSVPLHGPYDHIVSWLALYHIPDPARHLGRMRDLLKPGGGLWIEDLALRTPVPESEADAFASAMFPNSARLIADYENDLKTAGFDRVDVSDMTDDWHAFVATRLAAFRAQRESYSARHGDDGYRALESFYAAVAGYFEAGILAGIRVRAS